MSAIRWQELTYRMCSAPDTRRAASIGATALLLLGAEVGAAQQRDDDVILWYPAPAREWVEALPVGNGRLGAMIFGGAARERIQFNEETLWDGEPRFYHRPGAVRYLDDVRAALFEGDQDQADALASVHLMGAPKRQQSYKAFGDLRLEFPTIDSTAVGQKSPAFAQALPPTAAAAKLTPSHPRRPQRRVVLDNGFSR